MLKVLLQVPAVRLADHLQAVTANPLCGARSLQGLTETLRQHVSGNKQASSKQCSSKRHVMLRQTVSESLRAANAKSLHYWVILPDFLHGSITKTASAISAESR